MSQQPPVCEVRDLRKVFHARQRGRDSVVAIDRVSFAVAPGEALAVIGESGSGKTTLARILVGLETPTAGDVRILGAMPPHRRGSRARRAWARQIQMIFQNPYASLDPRQTVAASVEEVVGFHFSCSRHEAASRARQLLDRVGLEERDCRSRPRQLSGGQRQRAAIARALASEPTVLVLDEAVSALDVSIQGQILNLISDLRRESELTCVFISHDLAVVRQVTDTAVVMHSGAIVERGTTAAVLDRPTHPYTQRLRASVPGPGWSPPAVAASSGVTMP